MRGLSKDNKKIDFAFKFRIHSFLHSPMPRKETREEIHESKPTEESLETLLSKKSGRVAFRDFLKTEYCEENLDFWLASREFQTSEDSDERSKMAAGIYEEFIKEDSPRQVNLDFSTRDVIRQSLSQPSPSCFTSAQRKIYGLMENGSFPRFVQTEQYKLLGEATGEQKAVKKQRMSLRIKTVGDDLKVDRLRRC